MIPVFNIKRLPAEIRDQVWCWTFRPQIVMLGLKVPVVLPTTPEFKIGDLYELEIKSGYHHPQTLSLNTDSRIETLRHYSQILANEISKSVIYFNPDFDTLAFNVKGMFEVPAIDGTMPPTTVSQAAGNLSPIESMRKLKELLHCNETNGKSANNLAGVQKLAISGFYWIKAHDDSDDPQNRFLDRFEDHIRDGFQNLRELFIIFDGFDDLEYNRPDINQWDLRTMVGQDACRKDIQAMYERARKASPDCKIPQIRFLSSWKSLELREIYCR
jgi:hypothetical protein